MLYSHIMKMSSPSNFHSSAFEFEVIDDTLIPKLKIVIFGLKTKDREKWMLKLTILINQKCVCWSFLNETTIQIWPQTQNLANESTHLPVWAELSKMDWSAETISFLEQLLGKHKPTLKARPPAIPADLKKYLN